MEIKVNDYVRTKSGEIGKVVDRYEVNDYYKVVVDIRNGFIEKHKEHLFEKYVKVSSPNIIDLIEVGDYVNGYQVIEKPYMYHDIQFVSVDTQDSWSWGKGEMPVENIKSIVTKEQFKQMEYKIN